MFELHLGMRLLLWICCWFCGVSCSQQDPYEISFNFDKVLDENPMDVYNKTLAFKSTSTMRNYGKGRLPPTAAVPQYHPLPTAHPYVPDAPNRSIFFTPPVPPGLNAYPFADKPTLRGSNSDNNNNNNNNVPPKRPFLPPQIPGKLDKDYSRIPIKPPDYKISDTGRKKTINTPSLQKLPDAYNYSEPSSSSPTSTTHKVNDTYEYVVPMVQNISTSNIVRLLNNGKTDIISGSNKSVRLEQELKSPKPKEEVLKTLSPPTVKPVSSSSSTKSSAKEAIFHYPDVQIKVATEKVIKTTLRRTTEKPVAETTEISAMPDHPEPRARYILGVAWDIHVYLVGSLFAVLAGISGFTLLRMKSKKWLLPGAYFASVHATLALIGCVRSAYLFYDAYNIGRSFSEPVSRLLLNVGFPLLICVFTVMLVFALKAVQVKAELYLVKNSYVLVSLALVYLAGSACADLYADATPYARAVTLTSQCAFVLFCVVLGVTYIYLYKRMSHCSLRKNSVYGTAFTDPFRPSLAHAIRVMLATSLLSLLMATVQLIGVFFVFEPAVQYHYHQQQQPQQQQQYQSPHPWLWWAFQLSVRVIEISICFLLFWAAAQPARADDKETQSHNSASGFPLFQWAAGTPRGSENGQSEDIYPAMCAAHGLRGDRNNYTLRSNRQIYEDIMRNPTPTPAHLLSHTADRRSGKRYPPDGGATMHHHHHHHHHQHHQWHGGEVPSHHRGMMTLDHRLDRESLQKPHRRPPQPSPSMLIDEKGVVRFRSMADAEAPEEIFPSTTVSGGGGGGGGGSGNGISSSYPNQEGNYST